MCYFDTEVRSTGRYISCERYGFGRRLQRKTSEGKYDTEHSLELR